MKKSRLLYGLPAALNTAGPVVVVEGVTDVWRLGTNAVAIFGKTLSMNQRDLILRHFACREIVVFLDADATQDAGNAWSALHSARAASSDVTPVVVVRPPAGLKDVGECDREDAWKWIKSALTAARKQGRI
jgi:DNA primase